MKLIKTLLFATLFLTGCAEEMDPDPRYPASSSRYKGTGENGLALYLDGAGNLGYGQDSVPQGLRAAGFRGDIENIMWTSFTGPLGDQVIRANAFLRADEVTRKIVKFRKNYPNAPVYVIGLSAGTGVAVWGVERLPADVHVDSMVLLGSSLSSTFNMSKCLRHVKNKVFVLTSPQDAVLSGFIPVTGTIDGAYLVEPAGLVGLKPPANLKAEDRKAYQEKIVMIPWRSSFETLGNAGGHTDATSYSFVKEFIARHLLNIGQPLSTHPSYSLK
jgi:pimeloyl-ACP methyl ester carboxylesterase